MTEPPGVIPMPNAPNHNIPNFTAIELASAFAVPRSRVLAVLTAADGFAPMGKKSKGRRLLTLHEAYQINVVLTLFDVGIKINPSLVKAVLQITPSAPHLFEQVMFGEPPASILIDLSEIFAKTQRCLDDLAIQ